MVYKYVRKSTRGSWSEENLKRAIAEAKISSIKSASEKYGIPYATLYRHIKSNSTKKKLGRFETVFTPAEERELADYIKAVDSLFYGVTLKEFLALAGQFAKAKNKKKLFTKNIAGKDWYRNFKQRNPDIALRRPEPTSIARMHGFNKTQVQRFYDLLDQVITKENLDPTRIFNVDETGIKSTTNKPPKVLSTYGKRQVGVVSSTERGTLTTVVGCFSASGAFIPPFLIFKRKKACPRLLDGAPPGSQVSFTESGWINAEKFYDWMVFFVEQTRPTPDKKVLLLLDNHESHKSYEALEFASKRNVVLLTIPPHTSHKLQPLDVAVYSPLKQYFEQEVYQFQKRYPGRIINQLDISRILSPAYLRAASPINAISAFRASGIWPFNRYIFGEEVYMTSSLQEREEADIPPSTVSEVDPLATEEESTRSPHSDATAMNMVDDPTSPSLLVVVPEQVTTPEKEPETESLTANAGLHGSDKNQEHTSKDGVMDFADEFSTATIVPSPLKTPEKQTCVTSNTKDDKITPAHIRPLPVYAKSQITKRTRKLQKSEILTSTPIKLQQKVKMELKKEKIRKMNLKNELKNKIKKKEVKAEPNKRIPFKRLKSKPLQNLPSTSFSGNSKKPEGRNKENKNNMEEKCFCAICNELFVDPPTEDWVQCNQCKEWSHELCSSYTGHGSYYCDVCFD